VPPHLAPPLLLIAGESVGERRQEGTTVVGEEGEEADPSGGELRAGSGEQACGG
jgi:hypothetical protein